MINPLEHPICLEYPLWQAETAWAEHVPLAMFLVSATRPKVFVELGAFRGASYCAFCQAIKFLKFETRAFAVDTWQGDDHAGKLEAGGLAELRAHHDPLYADFSRLVQSTFDDALEHFADQSIDLLHIDGFHTFEAVQHDFQTWLPKMSEKGIVLFHDTNVRERGFGVWKFWANVKEKYPHFEFLHGHGLGVLAELRAHHDPLYADFSRLVQSTFDDALEHFADRSVDLLHIDGFHTFEAVRHDFQTWLPKMSEKGIVLFHDTNVRERGFGVWRFWGNVKEKYPHFEFLHGHGLGVLAVGGEITNELKFLFNADESETRLIREFFYQLGSRIEAVRKFHAQESHIATLENRVKALESYEQIVRNSITMRLYRILKTDGIGGLMKKGIKKVGQDE